MGSAHLDRGSQACATTHEVSDSHNLSKSVGIKAHQLAAARFTKYAIRLTVSRYCAVSAKSELWPPG